MIEVEGLTKYYGRFAAIKDVSFKIESGEIVGFLGPNGAGKTTTMRILTCYSPPSAGAARILGMDVTENSLKIRGRIGYLPESVPLYEWMRVGSYLSYTAKAKGVASSVRRREIERVAETVNIAHVKHKIIKTLSKGFKQRVGLAQALIGDPPILILDEPTIGLDPQQIREIRELIKGFSHNRTVILSSHILPEVSQVCDRVIIMNKGVIVAEDTPRNLTIGSAKSARIELIANAPKKELEMLLLGLPHVNTVTPLECGHNAHEVGFIVETEPHTDVRPVIAQAIVQKGWGLLSLRALVATLEDVFIDLVTEEQHDNGDTQAPAEEAAV